MRTPQHPAVQQASGIRVGLCADSPPGLTLIGIDMVDHRGKVFAHGHMDPQVMRAFLEEARRVLAKTAS